MTRPLILTIVALLAAMVVSAQEDSTRQVNLQEVTVTSAQQGMLQNRSSLGQLETINRAGLTKMACCTLSASFENSATTQTSYSDAVTGTRQIQMLGLSGLYTQTMAENIPTLRGLAYAFGWDYTPASWLDGISISKGAGTVVNGYEGITGQINLDFRKPNEGRPVYIDLYTDSHLHNELNTVLKHQFSPRLFGALFLHTTQTAMPDRWRKQMDGNDDGFMDMPKVHNYNIYNRWLYADEDHGVQSRLDVRFVFDQRKAGQMEHHMATPYTVGTRNLNFQASNKTGITIGSRPGQSLGIINSVTLHGLRTHYGWKTLDADQKTYYGNLIFNSDLGEHHTYQVGASYLFDLTSTYYVDMGATIPEDLQKPMPAIFTYHQKLRFAPKVSAYGGFAEYTNTAVKNLTLQAGLRADYLLHEGWLLTPRLNVKYNPADWLVARVSAGRGYRMANPLVENIGLMASARILSPQFLYDGSALERAWNIGGNLIFTIPIWNQQEATLSVDYYHVRFQNRLHADLDAFPGIAYIASSDHDGAPQSTTDTWQADLSMPLAKGLTLYAAWRYTLQNVVQQKTATLPGGNSGADIILMSEYYKTSLPLTPSYKALLNVEFATAMRRWIFDATLQLNGRTRLPGQYDYQQRSVVAEHSPAYALLFAQVTRRFRDFEFYVGGENLLSYRQQNPIIGWDEPFSSRFDASQVWAPITGRKLYAGIRINLGDYM